MAISEPITGTEAISTTEWSLATDTSYDTADAQTDDGVYQLWLDLSDMVDGDELEIRLYEKVRSGDTQRQVHMWKFRDAQADDNWCSPTVILLHGWDFTADAIAGTITLLWSIRKVA